MAFFIFQNVIYKKNVLVLDYKKPIGPTGALKQTLCIFFALAQPPDDKTSYLPTLLIPPEIISS
jgi:hypothetical protein